MRVGLVHYSTFPIVGGVEQIVAAHARLFREAGHEVLVISRRGDADVILNEHDPYEELKQATRAVDWVIAHNVLTMPFDMALTQALWRLGAERPEKEWTAWVHDIAPSNPDYQQYDWHAAPWNLLTQACANFAYVAISALRAVQFATLTGRSAAVIPNGIRPSELLGLTPSVAELTRKHRLLQRDVVLLHPTRLLPRKNVEFGMEVLAELRGRRDAVLLVTAANDPHNESSTAYESALRLRRTELGLESAVLLLRDEFSPQPADVASLYNLADGLFFPSKQEGFGLPVLEAALHRLPIFCTDLEPMNSLLEDSIYPFEPGASPADVAKLIERTLEDSSRYRARREAVRRYSWEAVWENYLLPLVKVAREKCA